MWWKWLYSLRIGKVGFGSWGTHLKDFYCTTETLFEILQPLACKKMLKIFVWEPDTHTYIYAHAGGDRSDKFQSWEIPFPYIGLRIFTVYSHYKI